METYTFLLFILLIYVHAIKLTIFNYKCFLNAGFFLFHPSELPPVSYLHHTSLKHVESTACFLIKLFSSVHAVIDCMFEFVQNSMEFVVG